MSDQNISTTISLEEYQLLQILLDKEYMGVNELKNNSEDKTIQVITDIRLKLISDLQDKLEVSHEAMVTFQD